MKTRINSRSITTLLIVSLSLMLIPVVGNGSEGDDNEKGPIGGAKRVDCITCEGTLDGTRWCDQGDGTVKDMTTGLVWLKDASWGGQLSLRNNSACAPPDMTCFDDAPTRAGILSESDMSAGLSDGSVVGDWRLPTKEELSGLANGTEAISSDNMGAFTRVQSFLYWSSTSDASYHWNAWYVHMGDGNTLTTSKDDVLFVWPVRNN